MKYGSNTRSRCSSDSPGPLSSTTQIAMPTAGSRAIRTVMDGVRPWTAFTASAALESAFTRICSTGVRSIRTRTARSGTRTRTSIPVSTRAERSIPTASCATA